MNKKKSNPFFYKLTEEDMKDTNLYVSEYSTCMIEDEDFNKLHGGIVNTVDKSTKEYWDNQIQEATNKVNHWEEQVQKIDARLNKPFKDHDAKWKAKQKYYDARKNLIDARRALLDVQQEARTVREHRNGRWLRLTVIPVYALYTFVFYNMAVYAFGNIDSIPDEFVGFPVTTGIVFTLLGAFSACMAYISGTEIVKSFKALKELKKSTG